MSLRFDENKSPYIDLGGDVKISLELENYQEKEWVDKAREELRESDEIVEASLQELRQLLSAEPDLNIPLHDDAFLIKFLRPRKYYAKSAYESIKGYYKLKANPDFILDNLSATSVRVALEERVVQLFPKRDQHGRRILYLEMGARWDSSKVSYPEFIRAANTIVSLLSLEPKTQLNGFTYIINFDKLTLAHTAQFKPKFLKNVLDFGQKCAPIRLKSLHFLNNSRLSNIVFKICKPFLGDKWSQRILFHGSDIKALHTQIDPSCLPVWLEGSCEYANLEGKVLVEFLEQYQDKFDELNSYGYKNKDN